MTERGVVFSIDPLPVLQDTDSTADDTTTDDTTDDTTTDDTTDDATTDDTTTTTDETGTTGTTDTTPPTINNLTLAENKSGVNVLLSLTTNETSECRYDTVEDKNFSSMDEGSFALTYGTSHTKSLKSLSLRDDNYTYYVRCQDSSGNEQAKTVSFLVTPVIITNTTDTSFSASPVILSVETDVDANCRYDENDIEYNTMVGSFTTGAGTTTHSEPVATLSTGTYTYYVRCEALGEPSPVSTLITFEFTAQFTLGDTTDHYAAQLFPAADMKNFQLRSGNRRQPVRQHCYRPRSTTDTTDSTTDTTEADTEDSDFLEEGNIEVGSGTGNSPLNWKTLSPAPFSMPEPMPWSEAPPITAIRSAFAPQIPAFVATAAYGSLFHPAVQLLRDFRDRFMLDNPVSRSLVHLYYRYSPPIADVISSNTILRPVTKTLLLPIVGSAWLTMRFGWLWLILPAAAMALLSWFGMQRVQVMRKEEL